MRKCSVHISVCKNVKSESVESETGSLKKNKRMLINPYLYFKEKKNKQTKKDMMSSMKKDKLSHYVVFEIHYWLYALWQGMLERYLLVRQTHRFGYGKHISVGHENDDCYSRTFSDRIEQISISFRLHHTNHHIRLCLEAQKPV